MTCWRCCDSEEANELGLCQRCNDELHTETLIPPGRILIPPGTLPEEIGPYMKPPASAYRTSPYEVAP